MSEIATLFINSFRAKAVSTPKWRKEPWSLRADTGAIFTTALRYSKQPVNSSVYGASGSFYYCALPVISAVNVIMNVYMECTQ